MKPQQIYWLDQKVIGFLCRLIGLFVVKTQKGLKQTDWRRIAIAKYIGMGSVVLATPLMQILRLKAPQAEIALVTSSKIAPIARMLPVDKVFTWEIGNLIDAFKTFPKLVIALRRWRPDAFFDLEFFVNTSALIAWLSGANFRIGFHHALSPRGRLLTNYLPFTPRHTIELFASLAWSVGISFEDLPTLWRLKYDPSLIRDEIFSLPRPFIVVNPNAGELALQRRWMPERFHQLIKQLLKTMPSMNFVLIGSKNEREYVNLVLSDLSSNQRIINLAGQLNLDELCFVLEQAILLVTNDSGPMHLAAALGTPCVALFGPETPNHYGPVGRKHRTIYKHLPCSPCLTPFDGKLFPCPFEVQCLRSISVEEVLKAIEEILSEL
ncbi:MAG: glycosyltransferase family 9 protein [Armatimonadetes bacterium]|nr:glycosyltransferase family 9 protein [Armatimonadota bacterium]MDW8029453.1 glycosyltransferase family 9 protein [Armatimonadota bacterium]